MIKTKNDLKSITVNGLREGIGIINITHLLSLEELKNKGKLFGKLELEINSSIGFHKHIDDFEVYYILKGKGLVKDNKANYIVEEGDVIYTTSGESHSLTNIGENKLELLAVVINLE
ncbi:cupin domain-containing protein [uncultured Cetobacterium sp.]|uniref:cupin domain-containing protein n=1 Tax=uncultured Cetobacterium sp. TaxID=527638 RepID=UPI002619884B|nr:cupin domain-containing protein [uncultured Cetobacterium sp.]